LSTTVVLRNKSGFLVAAAVIGFLADPRVKDGGSVRTE
jgi:hypothetical protein